MVAKRHGGGPARIFSAGRQPEITTPELDAALAALASAAQRVQSGKKKRGKGRNPPRAVAGRREEEAPAAQQGGGIAADE